MTKTRGMILNSEMVRALLEGRKTQTRRPVADWQLPTKTKQDPETLNKFPDLAWISVAQRHPRWGFGVFGETEEKCMEQYSKGFGCCAPYGGQKNIIWIRESGKIIDISNNGTTVTLEYFDGETWTGKYPERLKWEPRIGHKVPNGIFKEAARILAEITNVRVERIQDISEEDAVKEGCRKLPYWDGQNSLTGYKASFVNGFANLWNSIYPGSWERNDWVWVYDFKIKEQSK